MEELDILEKDKWVHNHVENNITFDGLKNYYTYLTTNKEYKTLRSEIVVRLGQLTDGIKKIEEVSSLIKQENKYVKSLIGIKICNYLESKYNTIGNQEQIKFIIPVGIPASGKSRLSKLYENNQTVILDPDNMRENIFNFVYEDIFDETINFNVRESNRTDLQRFIKKEYVNKLLIPLRQFINFGGKMNNTSKHPKCIKGFEPYCNSVIQLYTQYFCPRAMDIFFIFCKDKRFNFLYDAPNCDTQFRMNLMIRAKIMVPFDYFEIPVLVPELEKIERQIKHRNILILRQTEIKFSMVEFYKLFDINEDLLNKLSDDNKKIILEIKELQNNSASNFQKFEKFDLFNLLYELFNLMYKREENGHGVKDYIIKYETDDYIHENINIKIYTHDILDTLVPPPPRPPWIVRGAYMPSVTDASERIQEARKRIQAHAAEDMGGKKRKSKKRRLRKIKSLTKRRRPTKKRRSTKRKRHKKRRRPTKRKRPTKRR